MSKILFADAPDFTRNYYDLIAQRGEAVDGVEAKVADIIAQVRSRGFKAVQDLTQSFDHVAITADNVTLDLDGVLFTRVTDAYKAR